MTAQEWAVEVLTERLPITGAFDKAMAEARRAALRERDARWLAAVRPNDDGKTDDGWLWCGNCDLPLDARPIEDAKECCQCSWSADLRALLEEAGK